MLRTHRLAAMFAGAALLPLSCLAQLSFQNHTVATTGGDAPLHGDFNGDGREDLVNEKTLLLSNGDGTYAAPIALPAGADAIGDFNHDGKLDFLAYTTTQGEVPTIYLGNGNGTFQTGKVITGAGPVSRGQIFYLVVGDVNHDEKTDFITVNETPGNGFNGYPTIVTTWLSNGDGTFKKAQTFTTMDPDPNNINIELSGAYLGDFDGDGKPDLAINYSLYYGPDIIQVWYGDGAGNLGNSTYSENDAFANPLIVADVNNDGKSDLISTSELTFPGRSTVPIPRQVVFTGSASRTLGVSYLTPSRCVGDLTVADFNGDGINDLAYSAGSCADFSTPDVVIRPGTGGGNFGSETTIAQGVYTTDHLTALRATTGTRPDLVYNNLTQDTPTDQFSVVLLTNESTGNFPGCGLSGFAEGVQICSPGVSSTSPVKFSVAAAGPTPMRAAAVWVDGKKVDEQLLHAFSNYSFLDASLALSAGSHAITVYGTGWDNTLQLKSFTLNVGGGGGTCSAPPSAGVHVCAPASGAMVASPVQVQATSTITGATWPDGSVGRWREEVYGDDQHVTEYDTGSCGWESPL